jgi:hypothetical protein
VAHIEDHPRACGGFADVHKGTVGHKNVCLKVIRLYEQSLIDYALKVGLLTSVESALAYFIAAILPGSYPLGTAGPPKYSPILRALSISKSGLFGFALGGKWGH